MAFQKSDYSHWLEIGRGSFGTVYRARQISLDRMVCVKKSHPGPCYSHDRIRGEATAMAALQHPNVVAIHDFGRDGNRDFIVMEYVDGASLEELADLEADQRILCLIDACQGLAAIHRKGWIHRDIKPANLLVNCDGHTKVADFGLLFRKDKTKLTQESSVLGTVAYMSPEQVLGDDLTPAADIFGLCSIYWEILTGSPPFQKADIPSTMHAIAHAAPDFNKVPDPARAILMKGLAKKPQDRFASIEEMRTTILAVTGKDAALRSKLAHSAKARGVRKMVGILLNTAERELCAGNRSQAYFHLAEASRLDPDRKIVERLRRIGVASAPPFNKKKRMKIGASIALLVLAMTGLLGFHLSRKGLEDPGIKILQQESGEMSILSDSNGFAEKRTSTQKEFQTEDALWVVDRIHKPGIRYFIDGLEMFPQKDTIRISPGFHSVVVFHKGDTLQSYKTEWKAFEIRKN